MHPTLANGLWAAGSLPEYTRFRRAVHRVEQEQEAVLAAILRRNAGTEFGRLHGFARIRNAAEYTRSVPVGSYETHQAWIERAADGIPNVLTREPVRLFEPTSGSSGAAKLIPYNAALQAAFQRAIATWIADLFTHDPALLHGPAYWSVSPASGRGPSHTAGGIPVGFEDDTAYLAGWRRSLTKAVMAVPGSVRLHAELADFRYQTLLHLLAAPDLRLISVWHPTFLSLIVSLISEQLPECGDRLCRDLARGACPAAPAGRAAEVRDALCADTAQERFARLWPKLRLLSCWADAGAAGPAAALAAQFPHTPMQPKGLIATEAFVSIPLRGVAAPVLACRSHFCEFLPADGGPPRLAHELARGERYALVVTTQGGLYRYCMGDEIEVVGHLAQAPLLRFVGRGALVSDWFGEKLNEAHVAGVLRASFEQLAISPPFAMLACDTEAPPAYVLYLDLPGPRDDARLAAQVEAGLRQNFHYDYARRLGQLKPLRVVEAPGGAAVYMAHAAAQGQKLGGIKIPALSPQAGWGRILCGQRKPPTVSL